MNINIKRMLIVFVILITMSILWTVYQMSPPEGTAEKAFVIRENSNLNTISKHLKDKEFIKSPFLFSVYATVTGKKSKIVRGEHTIKQGKGYKDILQDLSTLENETEAIEVIVPEGLTVLEIADRLNKLGIVDRKQFLHAAKSWDMLTEQQQEKLGVNKEVKKSNTKFAVEGLLFPDTYYFEKNMKADEVIHQMTERLLHETSKITIRTDQTPYEMLTLASIIEKEALLNEEKRKIAGVFENRLKEGKKLQSCSTVQYLLERPKATLRRKDLKIKSPYNTYLNKGLPPGPISNPDLASIKAAANPEKHDYYYFVAKQDGTWSHFFQERIKNIESTRN
ncbi:endolytic transglycosylase MltG [Fictibacillus phosphorivorans]|uniref:endolytic transglycosylase MltG n=1 Tax=Fictibacillus phosphorivorans TaxID=1221500 RepID=UPI001293D873|nr:endolytic transglycosylase MltG [Fictibacillus phosphorivorans]MQR95238.1 endolytic transglycosylase MltG [Fictibacillus phosphorivorans]